MEKIEVVEKQLTNKKKAGPVYKAILVVEVILLVSFIVYFAYSATVYSKEYIQVSALHEAGHAVAYEYYFPGSVKEAYIRITPNYKVVYYSIIARWKGKNIPLFPDGMTVFDKSINELPRDRDYYRKRIISIMAGASTVYLADDRDAGINCIGQGNDSDRKKEHKLFFEMLQKEEKIGIDVTTFEDANKLINAKEISKEYTDLIFGACTFVDEHKTKIKKLTKELEQKKRLSGVEIREIINSH